MARVRTRVVNRRKLIWVRDASSLTVNPGGLLARAPLQSFEGSLGAQLIGATVTRVRGVVAATLRGPTGAGDPAIASVRMAMRITDHGDLAPQDYAIGALYGNQAQADWFFFEPFALMSGSLATDLDEADNTSGSEIRRIDVRSKRRFDELDQTVEMLIGAPAIAGPPVNTCGMALRWDLSFLIMLP